MHLSTCGDYLGSELAYWYHLGGKGEGVHFLSIKLRQSCNAWSELAFKALDMNHDRYITKSEMLKVSKNLTKEQVGEVNGCLKQSNICQALSVCLSTHDDSLGSKLANWHLLGGKLEGLHFLIVKPRQSFNA